MGVVRSWLVGIVAVVALAFGTATPAGAQDAPDRFDTVDVLDEVIVALEDGDAERYDELVDELVDDGHWLPALGWDALERRDLFDLDLVWALLDGQSIDPLLIAFDIVVVEASLLADLDVLGAFELAELELVDRHGVAALEVIDHRDIGISPEATEVLGPLPDDVMADPPDLDRYDQVIAMMANRLTESGYVLPDVDDLDQLLDGIPADLLPPPPGDQAPSLGAPRPDAVPRPDAAAEPPATSETPPADASAAAEPSEPSAPVEPVEPTAGAGDAPATLPDGAGGDLDDLAAAVDASPEPLDTASESRLDTTTLIILGAALIAAVSILVSVWRHRQHGALTDLAFRDGLTGLHNRRRFDDDLDAEVRHGARPTSVIMIDVDHFKQFNDTHGHAVGDDVLRTVGEVIARSVRTDDIPYRYGGEEFSVLLPDTAAEDAAVVGERIRGAIERSFVWVPGGSQVSVTASLGVSAGTASQVDQLVHRADRALYEAKETGRNRLVSA